jgi:hypothetical protein
MTKKISLKKYCKRIVEEIPYPGGRRRRTRPSGWRRRGDLCPRATWSRSDPPQCRRWCSAAAAPPTGYQICLT